MGAEYVAKELKASFLTRSMEELRDSIKERIPYVSIKKFKEHP
ncbi:MAG: hypothetical protein QXT26_01835 [Thermoproteota archaeon]